MNREIKSSLMGASKRECACKSSKEEDDMKAQSFKKVKRRDDSFSNESSGPISYADLQDPIIAYDGSFAKSYRDSMMGDKSSVDKGLASDDEESLEAATDGALEEESEEGVESNSGVQRLAILEGKFE